MKERPILFTGPMVRAIQAGRKTQTRRLLKLPLDAHPPCNHDSGVDLMKMYKCPYGVPGDRLWVRETFAWSGYACDQEEVLWRADQEYTLEERGGSPWKPSIHMFRWASRINLEVTKVSVERVQDISEEDSLSEGIEGAGTCYGITPEEVNKLQFKYLWNFINEKRGFGWDKNPWVWVVEFKEVKPTQT